MIEQSKYLPKQMNGPILNAAKAALEDRLDAAKRIEKYLYNLSISSAEEDELDTIGKIIGYPRPVVPEDFEDESNIFLFWSLPFVQNQAHGFSTVESQVGGRMGQVKKSDAGYMSWWLYRSILPSIAYIKRYGVTLEVVDKIAHTIDPRYTLSYNDAHDIVIEYSTNIGFQNVWILTQMFVRFATSPQVVVVSQ